MPVTKRERIWAVALDLRERAERGEFTNSYGIAGFTPTDVVDELEEDADVSARTVRDCLAAMHELEILAQRASSPREYRATSTHPLRSGGLDPDADRVGWSCPFCEASGTGDEIPDHCPECGVERSALQPRSPAAVEGPA